MTRKGKKAARSALPASDARAQVLASLRSRKMARSIHTFTRGSAERFYAWLAEHRSGAVPEGPAVWIGGDCHLGNLGPVADKTGEVAVQIRDLDQSVIGNPAHDLIRLGLSLATAVRSSNLPGVTTAHMIETMVEGYEGALADKPKRERAAGANAKAIQRVMQQALRRRWKHLRKSGSPMSSPISRAATSSGRSPGRNATACKACSKATRCAN